MNSGPVTNVFLNSPDLNELDKKCRWMQADLIDAYKQAAIEEADPTTIKAHVQPHGSMTSGISQRDVLDKARGVVFAKYPKAAKSRTNPPPRVKVLPRFNSFSDIDNMTLYADEVQSPELDKRKRAAKLKGPSADTSDHPQPSKWTSRETTLEPETESSNKKAKVIDDSGLLEDTPPPQLPPVTIPNNTARADSDKENSAMPGSNKVNVDQLPWTSTIPTRKAPPSMTMNVSKKRTLKDIDTPDIQSNKKIRLDLKLRDKDSLPLMHRDSTGHGLHESDKGTKLGASTTSADPRIPSTQRARHESPTDPFSDEDALFEQIARADEDAGDVSLDTIPDGIFSWRPISTAGTPTTAMSAGRIPATNSRLPVASELHSMALKQDVVEPSLRNQPSPIDDHNSAASYLGSEGRIPTCFRVAEALRIRANAMNAPISLSEANKPRASVEIELFARINLTYRESLAQVFVFEDAWFPNKLPILRAVHRSWRQCKKEAPALLPENDQQPTEGGFLCRVVLLLDTSKPLISTAAVHGEVVRVRAAEWSEIEEVRRVVEPHYQKV